MPLAKISRWLKRKPTSCHRIVSAPRAPQRKRFQPKVEQLEDRLVPSTTPSLTIDPTSYDPSHILVRFQPDVTDPSQLQLVGGTQLGAPLPLVSGLWEVSLGPDVSVTQAVAAYQASPYVVYAEPDYTFHVQVLPNDPQFVDQWGLNNTGQTGGTPGADIQAPAAWNVSTGSMATVVAVIDTGVDYNHPDLYLNTWINQGEIPTSIRANLTDVDGDGLITFRDLNNSINQGSGKIVDVNGDGRITGYDLMQPIAVGGWADGISNDGNAYVDDMVGYDFFNNDNNPMDDNEHGTHVAGIIGAVGDNNVGVTGINWQVQIMDVKFLDSSGSGSVSDAITALNYAVQMGAMVSNNSYAGGADEFSQVFRDAIQAAAGSGHIFVAAAGNDGTDNDAIPQYPANYNPDNIITVAATDENDQLAYFSNYGATTVDLGAPGVDIVSTTPNNTYSTLSGTSMATPMVTGVVALVRSVHPDWTYQQVINQVLSTVDPEPSLEGMTVTGGRLNAARALGVPDSDGPRIIASDPSGGTGAPVNMVEVTFNKTIDPTSFDASDIVSFTGPNGSIAVTGVSAVAGSQNQKFDITFAPQVTHGNYQMVIGPAITDVFGNPMNQDTDGTNGEVPDDQYTASFTIGDAFVLHSTDVPKPLTSFTNTVSTLTFDQDVNIADLNVQVNITTPDAGFIGLSLVSPSGTTVSLHSVVGFQGANFTNTIFDDEAAQPISSGQGPFTGSYRPDSPLSALDGQSAEGTWQLKVNDLWFYGGSLNSWSLSILANPPRLSVNDVAFNEGNSGDTIASFTVALSNVIDAPVTVAYATSAGTAIPGVDYEDTSGTLTFNPGELTKTVNVVVHGDTIDEPDETFFLNLMNASSNASIAKAQGVGTIRNDDAQVSINDASVQEGNSGTINAIFTVSLTNPSTQTVTVTYATADGTANAAGDYTAASGSLTFAPGETSKTITVAVKGDTLNEADETYFVNLTSVTNAVASDGQGLGTIVNDDPLPTLSVSNMSQTEGNSGTKNFNFTVSLSSASGRTVTVNYGTTEGTATAGSDYASSSGTLTFAPGQTSKTVAITINGDTAVEPDETFYVNLSGASNAVLLDPQGMGTIQNDDTSISIGDASVTEGDGGTVNATFTVSLSQAVGFAVQVNYATANGTAAAGSDYLASSGTLTIAAGQTSGTITVPVVGDLLNEANETLVVNLSNSVNAIIARSQGVGTIVNDDPLPSLSIGDVSISEGQSGTKTVNFTVSLSAASGRTVTVTYTTADGTATAGSDYVAKSGTLTFGAGTTTATIGVVVNGDVTYEGDETFVVNLSSPSNVTLTDSLGVATLVDDDSLKISNASVVEGDSGAFGVNFTVSLAAALPYDVSVDYATANGTAAAGTDYVAASGKLTFAAGETSKTITVLGIGDTLNEADQTFFVNLSNPVNVLIGTNQGTATIQDNDPLPSLSIGDVVVAEGNAGTKNVSVTVSLSAASGRTVTVTYATADGTATAGSDYVAKSGTLTFNAGSTTQTITVVVNGDTAVEPDETFFINLGAPNNAIINDGQAVATIANDDPAPLVTVNDVKITEGNSGTKLLNFTVALSAAASQTVTVNYATANGSASAGSDYLASSGTLTFTPGQTSKTVAITINGDTAVEPDETFFVNLTGASNAVLLDPQGMGTIQNDDTSLTIGDASITEGNSGTVNATFTVSLSQAVSFDVQVNYATANSTAAAGSDYLASNGTLTIAAGQTSGTITVPVVGDLLNEANETFVVNLSNSINAIIARSQGVGTIVNDDPLPSLSIGDVAIAEGQSGTKTINFTVSLSAASGRSITVNYTTADGTAAAGSDYVAKSGTLTFGAGTTTATIGVVVNGDVTYEGDETFVLNLSSPTNATLAKSQGVGTILDDDNLKISNPTVVEGDSGAFGVNFTVSLAAALPYDVSVDYATANGTAAAGADYVAASGKLTFAAGETSKTITVLGIGDTLNEADQTFFVNLSNPVNVLIGTNQATATIQDNDPLPSLSIGDVVVAEGNAGTKNVAVTVSLSAPSGRTVTVTYATADGTATAGSDYVAKSGTLTFGAGSTTQTITVVVNGDTAVEPDETFFVNLSAPSNAIINDGQGQVTILNDDAAVGATRVTSAHLSGSSQIVIELPSLVGRGLDSCVVASLLNLKDIFAQGGAFFEPRASLLPQHGVHVEAGFAVQAPILATLVQNHGPSGTATGLDEFWEAVAEGTVDLSDASPFWSDDSTFTKMNQ